MFLTVDHLGFYNNWLPDSLLPDSSTMVQNSVTVVCFHRMKTNDLSNHHSINFTLNITELGDSSSLVC